VIKLPRFLLDGDVRGASDHVEQAMTPDGSIKAGHDRLGRYDRLRLPNSAHSRSSSQSMPGSGDKIVGVIDGGDT
jgi:hypothetical protein